MPLFREIKAKARAALHKAMRVPAIYIPDMLDMDGRPPWEVDVRVHTYFTQVGDVKGTSYSFAERQDTSPRIIFWNTQAKPQRKAVISVSADEAYTIEMVDPPDGDTTTAYVVRLRPEELDGLPTP